jgi:alpha-beta hydrolase superfamily lysophospholipase
MPVDHKKHTLHAKDGTTLSAQTWRPEGAKAELLVVPGYADHAARYRELAHNLAEQGIATIAIDPRGHGESSGKRGHIGSWQDYITDVDAGWELFEGDKRFLLGHSQGGTIALDYATKTPPTGLIVTNPFLAVGMKVPAIKIWAGKILGRIYPGLTMANEIDPSVVSNDQAMVDSYARDPLVFRVTTAGWFIETLAAQARVSAMREVAAPLLYIYSAADPLVSTEANRELSEQLSSPDKTVWVREGERHEVLNEVNRTDLHRQIGEWIIAHA